VDEEKEVVEQEEDPASQDQQNVRPGPGGNLSHCPTLAENTFQEMRHG
jgi:hypothetical protein